MSAMGRSCLTCGNKSGKSGGGWCRIEEKGVLGYVESRIEPRMKRTTCLWSLSLEKYVLHVYMHMYVFLHHIAGLCYRRQLHEVCMALEVSRCC